MEPLEVLVAVIVGVGGLYLALRFELIWYKMGKLETKVEGLITKIEGVFTDGTADQSRTSSGGEQRSSGDD